ncbi:phytanoyl-CoA hydroxylase-interacting protein-like [Liolophura sinensis]|uniref:phytanoyl-CoA hydroxylase-interacting protein-like n=1 Tax=Liolophura sinensis TaxID=3198878 RepID=UPI00315854CA
MAKIPLKFRSTNDFSTVQVTYDAEKQSFTGFYQGTKSKKECLMAVFTLNLKETSPEGEVMYTPWLITSPFSQAKFELPLAPYLFSPEICVAPAPCTSEVQDTRKNTSQCVARVHFTRSSGVADFPYIGVGEPLDFAELVGLGPKMTAICLYKRALDFLGPNKQTNAAMSQATFLYRDKSKEYFGDIFLNHGGVMHPYLKDNTGDPKCPITNRLKGLFFSTAISRKSKLPLVYSPFGPHRFLVPLTELLQNTGSWKLYFADFYCLDRDKQNSHHVNLVLCEKDTDAYKMCEECLLALPSGNPFLQVVAGHSEYLVNSHIKVEVIYTKEIDIVRMCRDTDAEMQIVPSHGRSDPRGIPKNPKCVKCNTVSYLKWDAISSS